MKMIDKLIIFCSILYLTNLSAGAAPQVEKLLSFKTTLTNYSMGYSSASFAIAKD